MTTIELLNTIKNHAVKYSVKANDSIKTNSHMNNATGTPIPQEDINALLTDFINYIASCYCCDYALYTEELE